MQRLSPHFISDYMVDPSSLIMSNDVPEKTRLGIPYDDINVVEDT